MVNETKVGSVMAAPFEKTIISKVTGNKVSYQTVNDYGGVTPAVQVTLN